MTGGGLYILVAYGSQNIILSGNPDFTYFYTVLKKYSHFSFESATLQVDGPQELFLDQPIQIRAKIQRIGDLLSDLYFTFTLPDIYSKFVDTTVLGPRYQGSQYEFQWTRYIGAQKAPHEIGAPRQRTGRVHPGTLTRCKAAAGTRGIR